MASKISFDALNEKHFPMLLKWLNAASVKQWWDANIEWTPEKVKIKYGPRVDNKDIRCFIINNEDVPIGYIQLYDAYRFPRSKPLSGLPTNLGAIDFYIAEEEYLGRGLGEVVLKLFIDQFNEFQHLFVDPSSQNFAAVATYTKAGFKQLDQQQSKGELWMVRDCATHNL